MPRALFKGTVLAESELRHIVEGNYYFPPDAVDRRYLRPSDTHTVCGWKGVASYHQGDVDGEIIADAAWFYPDPLPAAGNIKDYVAFWKGVSVEPKRP
jgi:uncharacterized protein (DUF427 family)